MRVLFVCLGNICRSPLAEGIFRAHAPVFGLNEGELYEGGLSEDANGLLFADSAGTGGWHIGAPPDPRSIAVAKCHGIDIASLRGRQVTAADFDDFDYILAMDRDNLQALETLRGEGQRARLELLMQFAPDSRIAEIPDPYYFHDAAGFERIFTTIAEGVDGLLAHIKRTHFTPKNQS